MRWAILGLIAILLGCAACGGSSGGGSGSADTAVPEHPSDACGLRSSDATVLFQGSDQAQRCEEFSAAWSSDGYQLRRVTEPVPLSSLVCKGHRGNSSFFVYDLGGQYYGTQFCDWLLRG